MCARVIREYLAFCFNKCIDKEFFSDSFKLAEVIVLVKNGVKSNQSNYRPISFLSTIGKRFERSFYLQYAKH